MSGGAAPLRSRASWFSESAWRELSVSVSSRAQGLGLANLKECLNLFIVAEPEPSSLGKQPALTLSVRFQVANGSETYGTYPRRTAGALGRALRVRGALGSSRQKWPKRPISSSYRPYAAWMDAFQTLVHV